MQLLHLLDCCTVGSMVHCKVNNTLFQACAVPTLWNRMAESMFTPDAYIGVQVTL